jgi:hypothetical protein
VGYHQQLTYHPKLVQVDSAVVVVLGLLWAVLVVVIRVAAVVIQTMVQQLMQLAVVVLGLPQMPVQWLPVTDNMKDPAHLAA